MTRYYISKAEQDLFALFQEAFGENINPYDYIDVDWLLFQIIKYFSKKEKL